MAQVSTSMETLLDEPFLAWKIKKMSAITRSSSVRAGPEAAETSTPVPNMRRCASEPTNLWNAPWEALDDEISSIFSDLRSQSAETIEEELAKEHRYAKAGCVRRAFPERSLALLVTLALEIPVAFIITGGSQGLKQLVGPDRYTLLMAFLPLTSAISGNVGLQASSLTTRAISHGSCDKTTYCSWMRLEVATAGLLSIATGFAVALLALVWTWVQFPGPDIGFALTVGVSQAFSIIVAGITGSIAPVIFSFIFHGDAGKWAGPMETAVQDVAGAFGVVYCAAHHDGVRETWPVPCSLGQWLAKA